jgi:hypothetical protein
MVFIGETTTGPAQDGNFYSLERGNDVVANAAGVWNRTFLADPKPLVNTVAQVLGELTVDIAIDCGTRFISVDHQMVCAGGPGFGLQAWSKGQDAQKHKKWSELIPVHARSSS